MKIKFYLTMMAAAVAVVLGMSSCGNDDDEAAAAVAEQVAGTYMGNEVIMVMGEESSNGTSTYSFSKSTDVSVDMTIPESGGSGSMSIPALAVKNIILAQSGNTIVGKLSQYDGKVTNAKGEEKAYTISDLTVIFSGNNVVATFTLKYGNMPFGMSTTFTGTRK